MPHCSECGCDLPTFETLCSKCYDSRHAGMGRPKHFLESMQQFLSNPLRLTAEDLLQEEKVTLPVALACWCGGLLICWFGGLARADFKCSALSDEVLSGALICVLISVGATLALARTNGKLHWRIASTVFAVVSWGVMGFLHRLPLIYTISCCKIAISLIDPYFGEQTAQAGEIACYRQLSRCWRPPQYANA